MPDISTNQPPRRRIHFGLRSLFVLVTIVALASAWAGYSLNWIRERRVILNAAVEKRARQPNGSFDRIAENYLIRNFSGPKKAPGGLWLFGEQGVDFIGILYGADEQELERIRRLFPEAAVTVQPEEMRARLRKRRVQRAAETMGKANREDRADDDPPVQGQD